MYKHILLASDGSKESLVALREGALIARAVRADAHLLIIERETPGLRVADSVYPTVRSEGSEDLLQRGLNRLRRLGVQVTGEVIAGEPAPIIAAAAKRFAADLVVVGHRRQTLLERWWSGASGAYLVDNVGCSVLVARDVISDAEFEAALLAEPEKA
jgi:nucleotide-binding universal stress UspA family protein